VPQQSRQAQEASSPSQSKQDVVIQMLRRRSGVTIEEIIAETGWQPHSVRGFFSGLVKKKLKLPLTSEVGKDGVRRYHIVRLASRTPAAKEAEPAVLRLPSCAGAARLPPPGRARLFPPTPCAGVKRGWVLRLNAKPASPAFCLS
jgi:hypothetical protein